MSIIEIDAGREVGTLRNNPQEVHMATPPKHTAPPRYKAALMTWLGAYPVITIILFALGPPMARWPLLLRTLVISGLMVVTLSWFVLPALAYILRGWLTRRT